MSLIFETGKLRPVGVNQTLLAKVSKESKHPFDKLLKHVALNKHTRDVMNYNLWLQALLESEK